MMMSALKLNKYNSRNYPNNLNNTRNDDLSNISFKRSI